MPTTAFLIDPLEEALKREGLYSLIPPERRPYALAPPAVLGAWTFLLACGSALPIARHGTWTFLKVSLANAAIILVITYAVGKARSWFTDRQTHLEALERSFIALCSVGVAVSSAAFSHDPMTSVTALAWSAVLVVAIAMVRSRPYRAHTAVGLFRLAARMARKSVALLAVLMPLSLAVVVFTLFTEEVWTVLGELRFDKILIVGLLSFLPVLGLVLASTQGEADLALEAASSELHPGRITEVVGNYLRTNGLEGRSSAADLDRAVTLLQPRGGPTGDHHLLRVVRARVRMMLLLLLTCSALILFVALAIYLFVLCDALFTLERIEELARKQTLTDATRYALLAKVAVVLAAIVTSLSSIQALNDDALDELYQHWFRADVVQWLALGALYRTLVVTGEEPAGAQERSAAVG